MCDYCGCRETGAIEELSEDHELALHLVAGLRRTLEGGAAQERSSLLRELQQILPAHLEKEEAGIFARLEEDPGFAWYLGELTAGHANLRAGLLSIDGSDADALAAALDELEAHIDLEEHDLFPASRMIIDDAGWEAVAAVHAARAGRRGSEQA